MQADYMQLSISVAPFGTPWGSKRRPKKSPKGFPKSQLFLVKSEKVKSNQLEKRCSKVDPARVTLGFFLVTPLRACPRVALNLIGPKKVSR